MTIMESESVLPCPLFEGSEKRLAAEFSFGAASPIEGLRALSRGQLDALLRQAACCIVSHQSNEEFDAYVLSESSLFVYPERLVLKTCGTTALLAAVPLLLEFAASLNMRCSRFKYSRASFLFPEKQPAPYQAFEDEVAFLEAHVGHMGGGGNAYVLGDALHGLRWHIYVAAERSADGGWPAAYGNAAADHSIEVCMTELCPVKAAQFVRGDAFVSARRTTADSGIGALLAAHDIDEFVFEPCGYSMNGLMGGAFSTIHITPEAACSYASVELTGCPLEDTAAFVAKSAEIFRPVKMTVCVTCAAGQAPPPAAAAAVAGYVVLGTSVQRLPDGGIVVVHSLQAPDACAAATSVGTGQLEEDIGMEAAAGKLAASGLMEEDGLSQVSELTGMELSGLLRASVGDLAACSSDDDNNSCGGGAGSGAVAAMCASYASSLASEAAKSGPATPEPEWQLIDKPVEKQRDTAADMAAELAGVLARHSALPLPPGDSATIDAYLSRLIRQRGLEDPVCCVDLGEVARLQRAWSALMPRVTPFYAVKCNNDTAILATLAALGAGFDCASDAELDMVLGLGVPTERIVFANACKRPRDIRHAAAKQVDLTTFDTACELGKLARWHPATKALLRIRADDPAARCQLGNKYGAEPADAPALLQAAKEMGVEVCGVSFHVGSGATNPDAFSEAIALSRAAFDAGTALGFTMSVLDIGGGFCDGLAMGDVAAAVNAALDRHFPVSCGVRVIAEPGRYFAEACATLACMVIGMRDGCCATTGAPMRDYWITDGIYGSMNSLLYDHATLAPRPLRLAGGPTGSVTDHGLQLRGRVFGPTCDGLDTVLHHYALPKLDVGDWLVFPNHGAYTFVGACPFNGMDPAPSTFYVFSQS